MAKPSPALQALLRLLAGHYPGYGNTDGPRQPFDFYNPATWGYKGPPITGPQDSPRLGDPMANALFDIGNAIHGSQRMAPGPMDPASGKLY